jgi:hypothetical protein
LNDAQRKFGIEREELLVTQKQIAEEVEYYKA